MPRKTLLTINYLSLCLFSIVIIDTLFLGGYIRRLFPGGASSFIWYHILFGLPHIIASFFGYGNREYLAHYKKNLIVAAILALSIIIFFALFAQQMFIYFLIAYTLYHFAWQQVGLCRGYIKEVLLYKVWSLSGIATAVTLGVSVGGEGLAYVPLWLSQPLHILSIISLSIFILASLFTYKKGTFVVTTSLVIIFASISIYLGYYAIGIIMLVLVHDVSAFSIYIKHDRAYRKKSSSSTSIYSLLRISPNFVIIVLPLISISLSYLLQRSSYTLFVGIILLLTFMHYYLEGIVWKRGTLHRVTLG